MEKRRYRNLVWMLLAALSLVLSTVMFMMVKAETQGGEKAQIAVILDDCYGDDDVYGTESIISLFDRYNSKLGLGVIADWTTGLNGLSPASLRQYYAAGHEILSHSASHENKWVGASRYTPQEAVADAEEAVDYLNSIGIRNVYGFITPFATIDAGLLDALTESNLHTEVYGSSTNPSQHYVSTWPRIHLNVAAGEGNYATATVAALKSELTDLIASGGKAVYFTHKTSEWPLEYFEELLAFVKSHSDEIEIVTPHQLVSGSAVRYDTGTLKSKSLISSSATASSVLEVNFAQLPSAEDCPDILLSYCYPGGSGATRYPTVTLYGADGERNIVGYGFKADGQYHTIRLKTTQLTDFDLTSVTKLKISAWSPFALESAVAQWYEFPETNLSASELTQAYEVGWCLGNVFEIPFQDAEETLIGCPYTTQEMMDEVAAKGFGSVRINASWGYHLDAQGMIKKPYIRRVKQVVDYAINAGMYVVLDYHHPVVSANGVGETDTATTNVSRALSSIRSIWSQVAEYFADYGQELAFEVLNEPRDRAELDCYDAWLGSDVTFEILNNYNAVAVQTIRAAGGNNADRLLILPTYANGTSVESYEAMEIPTGAGNVAVAIHAYQPFAFAFSGDLGAVTFGAAERSYLDSIFADMDEYFVSKGVPVLITESSATYKNNDQERAAWAEYFTSRAAQHGIVCFLWDNHQPDTSNKQAAYTEAFGFFNRGSLTWWHESVVDAYVRGAAGTVPALPDDSEPFPDPGLSGYAQTEIFSGALENGSFAGGGTNVIEYNSAVQGNVWTASGSWTANRIVLSYTVDTEQMKENGEAYLYVRYQSSQISWPEVRLLNRYGTAGDMKFVSASTELTANGQWQELYLPLSAFSQTANSVTLWGASGGTAFDFSQVCGIGLQFGGSISIAEITFLYKVEQSQPVTPPEPELPPVVVTVPETPSGVSLSLTGNGVCVSFDAVAGATEYIIQRSISWGSGYIQIAQTSDCSYVDTQDMNAGTRYYYRVIAINSQGESEASTPVGITVA